jgi:hypothetical protein
MRVRRSQIAWISLFVISSMAGVAGVMGWRRYQADPARVFSRAENAYQAGRWGEAGAALERLARLWPPTSIDRYLRAQVAVGLKRDEEALAELAAIPELHALAPLALWYCTGPRREPRTRNRLAICPHCKNSSRPIPWIAGRGWLWPMLTIG